MLNKKGFDILITGVGGQGTVLASRLLAAAAMEQGYFVRTSETIGMAQRGGSVTSHVRIGSKEKSPLIPVGGADLLIAFEPAEAVRSLPLLKKNAKCLVNTKEIKPACASAYDMMEITAFLQNRYPNAVLLDAYSLAMQTGSVKILNVLLLGVAFAENMVPLAQEVFVSAMLKHLPAKFAEINKAAFELGLHYK
ncbi:MAG: indolepyruvate oxidoreductase subunit beta [Clostridia bacterium]|nr:indolepyruvate oxidoreductase subunit beta [Clostridia bacterium]